MALFDLTIKDKIVPGLANWGHAAIQLPIADQDTMNIESMRDLERAYRIRVRLDSVNIHNNTWSTDLLRQIYEASYPLRELLEMKTTVKITREWLLYWELYSRCIIDSFATRMQKRKEGLKLRAKARAHDRKERYDDKQISLRGVPIRTFHVRDNKGSSVLSMQKAINRVEYTAGVQINWDWIATYSNNASEADMIEHAKNKEKWIMGIDGEGSVNSANMRAWKNKILTTIKIADVIIVNNENEETIPVGIAFALMNVAPSGNAMIYLPRIATAGLAAMIHLFRHCFEKTEIIHTLADDRMYLCGDNFLDNLTAKHHKLLYEFCDAFPGGPNIVPFTLQYITMDDFTDTVDLLMKVNTAVQGWRYEYYEKILILHRQIFASASSKTFENYVERFLEENYRDESQKWIRATGFNFFAE